MTKSRSIAYFVTEDWYFCSHRLSLAVAAKKAGYTVYVITRVQSHGAVIKSANLNLIPIKLSRRSKNPFVEAMRITELIGICRSMRPQTVHHVALKPVIYGSIAAWTTGVPARVNTMAGFGYLFSSESIMTRLARPISDSLASNGYVVTGTTWSQESNLRTANYEIRNGVDIGTPVHWAPFLRDVDYVVHLAARVHVMSDSAVAPLAEFWRVNSWGSEKLAESAAAAGVKRMSYVSTIKVLGEKTDYQPFRNTDEAAPSDRFAVSKLVAEMALRRIGRERGLEIVILRPPLIYGPRVGGNFLRVLSLVSKGFSLPLVMIRSARSMLAISNFCDVIRISLDHPDAKGETFLVSDSFDISTPELFRIMGDHIGNPARLFPVPVSILRLAGRAIGRLNEVDRLCDSLQVDIEYTRNTLNWLPGTRLEDGIHAVARWYSRVEL